MIKTTAHNLLTQLDRIERIREKLLEEVQLLPEKVTQKSLSEGKWSILEIIEHLVLGEDYVLNGVGSSEKLVHKRRRPYHFIRYFIVMGILHSSFKVKVPTRKMKPEANSTLEELTKRWEHNHQMLRSYLEKLDSDTLSDAVFFHPISGPLTPQKALNMMEIHLKRHWKQIREIASSIES